jgi:cell division protein FtsW
VAKIIPMRQKTKEERRVVKVEKQVRYRKGFDYRLIMALVALVALGLVMVFSSSYYMAEVGGKDQAYYFLKQLLCVGIGAVLMFAFMHLDYHTFEELPWKKYKWLTPFKNIRPYWLILVFGFVTLLLVFVPGIGQNINGSHRWINIGVSIQPSEIMKMSIIIFMACMIGRRPARMRYFSDGILPFLIMLGAACAIIYMQPNFSAIICIAALVMALLYIGGAKLSHLGMIVGVVGIALVIFIAAAPYRANRLLAWTDPWGDSDTGHQLRQSLISIGSGGVFGKGLGNSMQKMLYLPYRESDFIFAILAEELGLVGCVVVIGLFAVLIWRGIVAAIQAPDLTGTLLAAGATAMLAIQVVVNIGVNVGLLPSTGVVLPFISYGGSSVLIFMSMMGLVLNVGRQGKAVVPAAEKKKGFDWELTLPKEIPIQKRGKKRRSAAAPGVANRSGHAPYVQGARQKQQPARKRKTS